MLCIAVDPRSVSLTGNTHVIANGINTLQLSCTTESANPVPTISWKIGEKVTTTNIEKIKTSGNYGGMVLKEILTLTPTRAMDRNIVSCAFNSAIRDNVTLDLRCK